MSVTILSKSGRGELIHGVHTAKLPIIRDERGSVRHFMRRDSPFFEEMGRFGEVYFSTIWPNVVKAWHVHKRMTLNYVCVVGRIQLVLYDGRSDGHGGPSPTYGDINVIELADTEPDYRIVQIPPMVHNGFRAPVGWADEVIVANCADLPHHPDEIERYSLDEVDYDWGPHERNG